MRKLTSAKWTTSNGVLLMLLCSLLQPSVSWALTAANTLLRNQASATFKDETGTSYTVSSNVVETLIQQVAGLDLTQSQSKLASAGGTVEFVHVVTNTGNGDDKYTLTSAQPVTDQFDFTTVSYYADANNDGQADDMTSPINVTPLLKAGASFSFVAVAAVPSSATDGNTGQITVTANSAFTTSTTLSNTDTAKVTTKATLDVTKSISKTRGLADSGTYTVTLRYRNTSQVDATNVTLIDTLPVGMNYADGTGRWSQTGTTVLTDVNATDSQGTGLTIQYCAYDSSCTGVAEANRDADSDSVNQVTAIMNQVAAGAVGELKFEVNIAANVSPSTLVNVAEYEFNDSNAVTERFLSNAVSFTVLQQAGVVTNGSKTSNTDGTAEPITVASVKQTETVVFNDYVWNTGNGNDSFDLTLTGSTFPVGTTLQLFQADGFTPLLDSNGNGTPDVGNLAAGAARLIVVKAILPADAVGNNGGLGFSVTLTATSTLDSTKSNPAINLLGEVIGSSVDLTNNAALGDAGVLGDGMGPESAAVVTRNTMPNSTTEFILYVNNTSGVADNYDLQVSTDSTFNTVQLPTNWKVRFLDEAGKTITNSGMVAASGSKRIFAEVTVPAHETVGTHNLFFRVMSPTSGAMDVKHDALTIDMVKDVVLFPDNSGQVLPGGTVVYSHWLVNQGNIAETNIALSTQNDTPEWQSVIYADTDGDGTLSAADQPLSTVATLGINESLLIFVKVNAASTIPMGVANVTQVNAAWDGGSSSTQALDVTTTNSSDVSIRKSQALDATCDGTPDFAFSFDDFPAEPNQCVLYQLTATNTGAEAVHNVKIQDATPSFTLFNNTGGLPSLTQGALEAPVVHGGSGTVIGNMGNLASGASASLVFGIKIKP